MMSWRILIVLLSSTCVFSLISDADPYPFLVTVFHKENALCGGIVISKYYILTAASCLDRNTRDLYVVYGDPENLRRVAVDGVFIAPNYKVKCHKNDLAVLKVNSYLRLRDPEMGVKRVLLAKQVELIDCFNIYMTKDFETIPGPTIWSKEGVQAPNPKYNDFSLEIGHPSNNVTNTFPLKGSPLICNRDVVGLYSVPWTNPKSGRILELYTQIPLHNHWIGQLDGNPSDDNRLETIKPYPPAALKTSMTVLPVSPVTTDKPNGGTRLQLRLLLLVVIALAPIFKGFNR